MVDIDGSFQEFNWTPRSSEKMMISATKEDRAFGEEVYKRTPEMIAKYGIKPNPIIIKGNFEDIGKGLEDLKVSVSRLSEGHELIML